MQAGSHFDEALAAFHRGQLDRARTLAEQELDQTSGSAAAQHLLGLIDCRTGRLETGVELLRGASEAEPGNIAFRVMLMRALVDSGRSGEALALPAPDSATAAGSLPLWHARAEAADAAGDPASAEQAWRIVASARPADWRAASNLGNALAAQGRWADAGEALSTAASLNPSDLAIRRNAGSALIQANRIADAISHFMAVATADPRDSDNRIL
ncbi:MAG: tetratricopeptide repeat protein, partial [Sphingomicrobium sp.]